jgi:hypothetical protein
VDRAVICRDGLADTDLVSIDLSADDWRGMSVAVRQATNVIAISVDDGSHLLLQADGSTNEVASGFGGSGWQRLTVSLDLVQGSITFRAEPRGGYAGVSNVMQLPSAWQATTDQSADVCVAAPSNPAAELFVDNLVISAGHGQDG